ncbi:MAG: hypothetical protein DRJ55_01995 [Thermoprotei archaeon]|nr:MAG: hypothetical protein DRJ55_01995 [Thermoprotei archaeon]
MDVLKSREVALTSVFTALVTVTTIMFQVYIPETKGYFNLGEVAVYLTALLLGPRVGAFAGGVGSALADLITGYSIYAPATLVIKGLEGYIVGKLSRSLRKRPYLAKPLSLAVPVLIFIMITAIGTIFYTGTFELSSYPPIYSSAFQVEAWMWVTLAAVAAFVVGYESHRAGKTSLYVISMIAGGAVMVTGYFLYESALYGPAPAAVEVPFNIGQVVVGIIGGLALYEPLSKIAKEK